MCLKIVKLIRRINVAWLKALVTLLARRQKSFLLVLLVLKKIHLTGHAWGADDLRKVGYTQHGQD